MSEAIRQVTEQGVFSERNPRPLRREILRGTVYLLDELETLSLVSFDEGTVSVGGESFELANGA